MDSGNSSNQQQRYCSTPIMAPPPSGAASPPIMGGANVMGALHQPTHHPPPSISPHPVAYYGHHTAGTSHYPTPSATPPPPPMHHQQYYPHSHAHSYYAHGSHQQAQQQQSQQSQHHAIANAHVPINTPPGSAQPTSQHSHLMAHGSYHHPQSPAHHQQWASPTHIHQQQSHHYYHQPQPTHHSPSQQQQQTQQHGYPPPTHSPYPYVQPHTPAPTPPPPPHTPHAQPQHLQQSHQPQQHPPQVSVSPGPGQIHQQQTPSQQQQPQSHALMNLSRFVSQQSPSPSPRASPSLAVSHHPQQMSQMGPTSPTHFSGHIEHHSQMNGHTPNTGVNNSPVMSPPPVSVPNQQSLSPTSSISQHPLNIPPQQNPYNINGGDMFERHSPAINNGNSNAMSDECESTSGQTTMKVDTVSTMNKERDLPSVFSNITASKIVSFMNSDLKKSSSMSPNVTKSSDFNSVSQINAPNITDVDSSLSESGYTGILSNEPVDCLGTTEVLKDTSDSAATSSGETRASCSPSKAMGSPSNSGNGHQMMPVRLQNMHKGARTKANMKKLMQEQQITTPNGQVTDTHSDVNAKDADVLDLMAQKQTTEKPAKSSRKKKAQTSDSVSSVSVGLNESLMPMSPINMDLTAPGDTSLSVSTVIRPGYTKPGKKIGRPRKDVVQTELHTGVKPRKKRESKTTSKKNKKQPQLESIHIAEVEIEKAEQPELDLLSAETEVQTHIPEASLKIKRKTVKTSRKRSSKLSSDTGVLELPDKEMDSDLTTVPRLLEEQLNSAATSINESVLPKKPGKKRSKKHVANNSYSSDSTPDSSVLNNIPGSQISEREAESVALSVKQISVPTTSKGKRKGKKAAAFISNPGVVSNTRRRRSKSGSSKRKTTATVVAKEVIASPEREELPRLRSRSPKQRESPPLRISSPRAAKDRSSTPATSTSQTSTGSRSRASREKETVVGSPVTTPLSSPSLRSPKKSPEKVVVRSSSRQKASETLNTDISENQKDLVSPTISKRSRQVSKESLDSVEFQKKGRRKPGVNELRLSSDFDRSPPLINKRASRRKSGSITGSIDNLSSPSFNQTSSSLSLIPSDGSLEMPSDISNATNMDNSSKVQDQQNSPVVIPSAVPLPSKRRKPKRIRRTKSKSSRSSVENIPGTLAAYDSTEYVTDNQTVPAVTSSQFEVEVRSSISVSTSVKAKKPRRAAAKKGRRRSSTAIVAPVDCESQEESNPVFQVLPIKTLATKSKRKGAGKSKKQIILPNATGVLNIPVPGVSNVTKKNVQFRAEVKTRKQSKKAAKYFEQSESLELRNTSNEILNMEQSQEGYSETDLELSPAKRRRSSLASATNTQVSAKLYAHNEPEVKFSRPASVVCGISPPSKALRRDSRSVSRDYDVVDVSVVLTDIAQTLTAEDSSLRGISTSLSRLQSPTTTFTPTRVVQSLPEQTVAKCEIKEEESETGNTLDTAVTTISNKGKRKLKIKSEQSEDELAFKKKLKITQPNYDFQKRKAILEKEVAMVLLDLKTGSSSKSPSPAKLIPCGEPGVISKKKNKARKRKYSKSPRRSIDNSAGIQDNFPTPVHLNLSVPTSDVLTMPPQSITKESKRKGATAKRSPAAKKLKMTPSLLSLSSERDADSGSSDAFIESMSTDAPSTSTSINVAKTAVIPTASSVGIVYSSPVVASKSKPKVERKKTPTKAKVLSKAVVCSPDITSISTVSLPLKMSLPKQKRKRSKKEPSVILQNSIQSVAAVSMNEVSASQANITDNLPSTSSSEAPLKKKRQRKAKTLIIDAVNTGTLVPSTSTALAVQLPSTSKLFPYQISPMPYKKPTVICKTFSISDATRDDDNQKKKTQDTPSLKVIGGRAKFYRGGEVEEVDPAPKLPKEKAQLQTDNAVPWICSFCHLGPHAQKLGDLFGPYFAKLPSIYGQPSLKRETWMHGDCAMWAGKLMLIGTFLRNLEETLTDADKEMCTICERNGATMGCLRRGCKEAVHYPCAVRRFWKIDDQNFHSYCPKHIQ